MSKVIILDPGHGGSDPGAVGNGLKEKDLNLVISLATRDELAGYDCTVKLTRTNDVYVALSTRAAMGKGADLFVSQHNNAFTAAARGFETFANSGNVLPQTLGNRDTIHDAIYPYLKGLGVPNRGKKRYDHYITRMPVCSTVLVEYLFVTNAADAALLKKTAVLKELGRLTAVGIAKALGLKKKVAAPKPAPPATKLPAIDRAIGIEVAGKTADEPGYLINNATYVRAAYLIELTGGQVTGHGEYVNITLPAKVDTKKLEGEIAALKKDNAALTAKISAARSALN